MREIARKQNPQPKTASDKAVSGGYTISKTKTKTKTKARDSVGAGVFPGQPTKKDKTKTKTKTRGIGGASRTGSGGRRSSSGVRKTAPKTGPKKPDPFAYPETPAGSKAYVAALRKWKASQK